MEDDKEWLEIVKEIGLLKDEIKNSSKNILSIVDDPMKSIEIDKEILDILNAMGKIGMYADNASSVGNFNDSWTSSIRIALNAEIRLKPLLVKQCLEQICGTSFWVKKKGRKIEIKIPDINILKIP